MARRNRQVDGDSRAPGPDRARQATGPGEHLVNGLAPQPSPRQGESIRLYRRARVTAS